MNTLPVTYTSDTVDKKVDGKTKKVHRFDVTIGAEIGPLTISWTTDHSDIDEAKRQMASEIFQLGADLAKTFDTAAPLYNKSQ